MSWNLRFILNSVEIKFTLTDCKLTIAVYYFLILFSLYIYFSLSFCFSFAIPKAPPPLKMKQRFKKMVVFRLYQLFILLPPKILDQPQNLNKIKHIQISAQPIQVVDLKF